jgi:hypothetical protein
MTEHHELVTRCPRLPLPLRRDRAAGAIPSVAQLLRAIEDGTVTWDELLPECLEQWDDWADYRNDDDGNALPDRALARFDPADDAEHNANAVAWWWNPRTDTWLRWPSGNAEVFRFGWVWLEVDPEDVAAAKDSIRGGRV